MTKHEDNLMTLLTDLCRYKDVSNLKKIDQILELYYAFLIEKRTFFSCCHFKSEYTFFVLHSFAKYKKSVARMKKHHDFLQISHDLQHFARKKHFYTKQICCIDELIEIFHSALESDIWSKDADMSLNTLLNKHDMLDFQGLVKPKHFYQLYINNGGRKLLDRSEQDKKPGMAKKIFIRSVSRLSISVTALCEYIRRENSPYHCCSELQKLVYEFLIYIRFLKNYNEKYAKSHGSVIFAALRNFEILSKIVKLIESYVRVQHAQNQMFL